MNTHRMSVARSLKDKLCEFSYFLNEIHRLTLLIRVKHLKQDYPINEQLEQLNYVFSAFLNTLQGLKDGLGTALERNISWGNLTPTYSEFVFFCRNATTHDGMQMINGGKGTENYIVGPLERIDNKGKLLKYVPPSTDVLTICCNLALEVLKNFDFLVSSGFKDELQNVEIKLPTIEEFKKQAFIPNEILFMIESNYAEIQERMLNKSVNYYEGLKAVIEKIRSDLQEFSLSSNIDEYNSNH